MADLLLAQTGDLRKLAAIVGADPKVFYRGADLSKSDLSGQDLRGMNFEGAILKGANIDDQTKIDDRFDPIDYQSFIVENIRLSLPLVKMVAKYEKEVNYKYRGSALKSLVDTARSAHRIRPDIKWVDIIKRSPDLLELTRSALLPSTVYRINLIMINVLLIKRLEREFGSFENGCAAAILIGLVSRKMSFGSHDLNQLNFEGISLSLKQ